MENLIGQRIDSYIIDAQLGEGGMGVVYRAIEAKSQNIVALKLMHPHLARRADFRARFFQEADIVLELKHPSIVPVQTFTRNNEWLYIVMDYIEGGSLAHYLNKMHQQGQMVRMRETLLIIAQVSNALDFAHNKGVHHRDIKPDNILLQLDRTGSYTIPVHAFVADFGLAKIREGGQTTKTGSLLGTPAYLSPEYCSGKPIDGRSDLYSLGIVLYQLTTGRVPFQATGILEGCEQHRTRQVPAPRSLHPGMPENVATLITKAIAKYPHDRFQSGAEMAQALIDVANQLSDDDIVHFPSGKTAISLITLLQSSPFPQKPTAIGFDEVPVSTNGDQLIISQSGSKPWGKILDRSATTYSIGRANNNDIVLKDHKVSRNHAILQHNGSGWVVIDQNSANGTMLNGQRLPPKTQTQWQPNTTLIIDPFFLHWRQAGQTGDAPDLKAYEQTEFTLLEETEILTPSDAYNVFTSNGHKTNAYETKHSVPNTAVQPQSKARAKWSWIVGGLFLLFSMACVGTMAFYCSTTGCNLIPSIPPTSSEIAQESTEESSSESTPILPLPTETPEKPTNIPVSPTVILSTATIMSLPPTVDATTPDFSATETRAALECQNDSDEDGLIYCREVEFGTDPSAQDTDNDGLFDGEEVNIYETNPLHPDTDSDGLVDLEEIFTYGTSPTNPDSNGNGILDGAELEFSESFLEPLLEPGYGSISLIAGPPLDAYFVQEMTGSGTINIVEATGVNCEGYVHDTAPDFRIIWSGVSENMRVFFFDYFEEDTTILINDPNGNWFCNDDFTGTVLDPLIDFPFPFAGQYDVWIGTYEPNHTYDGFLLITEWNYTPTSLPSD